MLSIVFILFKYANSTLQRGERQIKHTHTHTHTTSSHQTSSNFIHAQELESAAFLRVPNSYPGCLFTNQELIIVIKIRVKAPLQLILPSTCMCSSSLDDFGSHLFKCRIGGEWDHRNSVFVHLMASMWISSTPSSTSTPKPWSSP